MPRPAFDIPTSSQERVWSAEQRDINDAVERLREMARHLPEPLARNLLDIVSGLARGQHPVAVRALLRPAQVRKARELLGISDDRISGG